MKTNAVIAVSSLRLCVAVLLSLMLTASIASAQTLQVRVGEGNFFFTVSSGTEVTLEAEPTRGNTFLAWEAGFGAGALSNSLLPERGVNPFIFTAPSTTEEQVLLFQVRFSTSDTNAPVIVDVSITVTAPPTDRPTTLVGSISDQTRSLTTGSGDTIDAAGFFIDPDVPDSADLIFTPLSDNPNIATVDIDANGILTIQLVAVGTTIITIEARDGSNDPAIQRFTVTVRAAPDPTPTTSIRQIPDQTGGGYRDICDQDHRRCVRR